jgi:type II secretory ATPase GspE/PulE/Tfp pilus assembly ATPase PilB-like protein
LKNYFFWDDGAELPKLFKADGCSQCGGTGFRGRLGIHELFKVNQEVRDYILKGRTYNELRKLAYRQGFTDMRFDGFKKALQGLTTLEEIVRVTASDA